MQGQSEAIGILPYPHLLKPSREAFTVTGPTSFTDMGTAGYGIPSGGGPLDGGRPSQGLPASLSRVHSPSYELSRARLLEGTALPTRTFLEVHAIEGVT